MYRILVVDDSFFMRNAMKRILIDNGHSVAGEAENGLIALELYKKLLPDAVTMDITMNEMTGLEALREILAFDSNAIVIMVSAMGQRPYVEEAIRLGAKGFFVKPYDDMTVVNTIERLCGK